MLSRPEADIIGKGGAWGVLDPQPLIFVLSQAGSLHLIVAIHYRSKTKQLGLVVCFLVVLLPETQGARPNVCDRALTAASAGGEVRASTVACGLQTTDQ